MEVSQILRLSFNDVYNSYCSALLGQKWTVYGIFDDDICILFSSWDGHRLPWAPFGLTFDAVSSLAYLTDIETSIVQFTFHETDGLELETALREWRERGIPNCTVLMSLEANWKKHSLSDAVSQTEVAAWYRMMYDRAQRIGTVLWPQDEWRLRVLHEGVYRDRIDDLNQLPNAYLHEILRWLYGVRGAEKTMARVSRALDLR